VFSAVEGTAKPSPFGPLSAAPGTTARAAATHTSVALDAYDTWVARGGEAERARGGGSVGARPHTAAVLGDDPWEVRDLV
jgi:hypothetical protein